MIADFFKGLEQEKVLVIGDIMLDRYLYGEVVRISPEAPVPVVSLTKDMSKIGGAGNVALNVVRLGASVRLLSLVGADENGKNLKNLIQEEGISSESILSSNSRRTTVKSRIISSGQHLMRIDSEDVQDLSEEELSRVWVEYLRVMQEYRPTTVLLQDYDKGLLSPLLIERILAFNQEAGIFTSIDPKKRDFSVYSPCDLIKPNLKEFSEYLGHKVEAHYDSLIQLTDHLKKDLDIGSVAITLSEHGIFIRSNNHSVLSPTQVSEIVDVCGAGDAVFVLVSLALKRNIPLELAGRISNTAGALVCSKVGVVAIERDQLKIALEGAK